MSETVSPSETGVLYSVFGSTFIAMAEESARSVKKVMPDCPVALFSDLGSADESFTHCLSKHEDQNIQLRKIDNVLRSPFERSILLDGDTYVIETLQPIFDLLLRFDLVVCHAPNRDPFPIKGIPEAFPELNCGMIGLRKSEKTRKFLLDWEHNYALLESKREQPSFRKTLFESDLSFFILTPEYNYRTNFPGAIGEGATVKILHGKGNDMKSLSRKVNRTKRARVTLRSIKDLWGGEVMTIRPFSGVVKEFLVITGNKMKGLFSRR